MNPAPENRCTGCPIRNSTICKVVSPAKLPAYTLLATEEQFSRGSILAAEGSLSTNVYILLKGVAFAFRLSPDGKRQIVQLYFPSEILGSTEPHRHFFSLQATTDIVVCRFDRQELETYMLEHPALEREMLWLKRRKLFGLQEQLVTLARHNALQAVASLIYYLKLRQRYSVYEETGPIRIPLSRNDICDFLSLTPETVSRCFSKMRSAKLIRMDRADEVEILDETRLHAAANQKYQRFDSDIDKLWG